MGDVSHILPTIQLSGLGEVAGTGRTTGPSLRQPELLSGKRQLFIPARLFHRVLWTYLRTRDWWKDSGRILRNPEMPERCRPMKSVPSGYKRKGTDTGKETADSDETSLQVGQFEQRRTEKAGRRKCLVLIPLGATEQHGPHLPTGTDSMLAEAACDIAAKKLDKMGRHAVIAPTVTISNSLHHGSYPGTLSLDPRLYMDYLTSIARGIVSHGFRNICCVNGITDCP